MAELNSCICDWCSEIENGIYFSIDIRDVRDTSDNLSVVMGEYTICKACYEKLADFLKDKEASDVMD